VDDEVVEENDLRITKKRLLNEDGEKNERILNLKIGAFVTRPVKGNQTGRVFLFWSIFLTSQIFVCESGIN
jgi:hypothetical protein